jgi:uncharacterized protein YheU (UPF0270 family)
MIVPHRELSAAALSGVIEEYVTRDGTNLDEATDKAAAVRTALDAGELVIVYDAEAESCNILTAELGREFLDRVQESEE